MRGKRAKALRRALSAAGMKPSAGAVRRLKEGGADTSDLHARALRAQTAATVAKVRVGGRPRDPRPALGPTASCVGLEGKLRRTAAKVRARQKRVAWAEAVEAEAKRQLEAGEGAGPTVESDAPEAPC